MRTAIGRIAGPLSPPTMFDSFGRRVSTSMAMARNVLTSETASAPASSAALANDATSVTFGVSFGMTGRLRHLPDGADHVERAVQAAAERDAAFLDVRAGDVQLERVHAFGIGEDARQLDVLVERAAADVDDDGRAEPAQLGQLLGDEAVDADALQADGVEHAGRRFDDALAADVLRAAEEQALRHDARRASTDPRRPRIRRRSRSSRWPRSADSSSLSDPMSERERSIVRASSSITPTPDPRRRTPGPPRHERT